MVGKWLLVIMLAYSPQAGKIPKQQFMIDAVDPEHSLVRLMPVRPIGFGVHLESGRMESLKHGEVLTCEPVFHREELMGQDRKPVTINTIRFSCGDVVLQLRSMEFGE